SGVRVRLDETRRRAEFLEDRDRAAQCLGAALAFAGAPVDSTQYGEGAAHLLGVTEPLPARLGLEQGRARGRLVPGQRCGAAKPHEQLEPSLLVAFAPQPQRRLVMAL